MNLIALHKSLHPKFGPYSGPMDSYSYRLGTDLTLRLKKEPSGGWEFSVFERGEHQGRVIFNTEADACDHLLEFVRQG